MRLLRYTAMSLALLTTFTLFGCARPTEKQTETPSETTTAAPEDTQTADRPASEAASKTPTDNTPDPETTETDPATTPDRSVPSEGLILKSVGSDRSSYVAGVGSCSDADIVIPETYDGYPVVKIAADAFKNCAFIRSVTLPSSMELVKKNAFQGCSNLQNVYYNGTKQQRTNLVLQSPNAEFAAALLQTTSGEGDISWKYEDGTLTISGSGDMADYLLKEDLRPWKDLADTAQKIVIGDGIRYVGSASFSGFRGITEIVAGKDVRAVGAEAFARCVKLQTCTFEGPVEAIAQGAVNGTAGLENVNLSDQSANAFLTIAQKQKYNDAFGKARVLTDRCVFDWASHMRYPTNKEIGAANAAAYSRSPYIGGWLNISSSVKYDRISVDVRSDHLPKDTYCCPANFILDYSYLESRYKKVWTEYGIGGYAGLQHGSSNKQYNGILSFWDVFCEDSSGAVTTIRAKQLYPEPVGDNSFGGEGTGSHALPSYAWDANKWYNLRLTCSTLDNGNTAIELSVYDYESEVETLLCKFDLCVPDVTFKGSVAFFLENFNNRTAGEIRSMALRDYRIRKMNGEWFEPRSTSCSSMHPEYRGSYSFFSEDGVVAMITTGVTDCAPSRNQTTLYFKS